MMLYRADTFASTVEAFECDIVTDGFIEIKGFRYRRRSNCFETEADAWRYLLTMNTRKYNFLSREAEMCKSNVYKCNAAIEKADAAMAH